MYLIIFHSPDTARAGLYQVTKHPPLHTQHTYITQLTSITHTHTHTLVLRETLGEREGGERVDFIIVSGGRWHGNLYRHTHTLVVRTVRM